jgi:hypothetical protein
MYSYPGFSGGLAFTRAWNEGFSLRSEVGFLQKGFRLKSSTEELKVRLNYIEATLLGLLALPTLQHAVVVYLEAGPSLGYGLGGKYGLKSTQPQSGSVKFGEPPSNPHQDLYFENPVDMGLQAGLAAIVKERWMIELRYGFGFMSVDEPPNPLPAGRKNEDYIMKNRVLQLSLGRAIGTK